MADDDEEDRYLATRAFRDYTDRITLDTVENGQELLEYLRREGQYAEKRRPDVVLLDLHMPNVDGFEAMSLIQADKSLRSIPLVVLASSETDRNLARCYDLGANLYIVKPVTYERLSRVVDALDRENTGI